MSEMTLGCWLKSVKLEKLYNYALSHLAVILRQLMPLKVKKRLF